MEFRLSAQDVAFVAIFATLSAVVIEFFPGIPIVGVSGSNIKFDAVLAPIYGLVIGPYLGFLAALIGGLVTAGSPFTILTSFSPAVSALVAGLLTQKNSNNNGNKTKGWMLASLILGLLILGWYLTGVGQRAPFYPILHIAGFALILATRERAANAFKEGKVEGKKWQVKSLPLLVGIIILVVAYMLTRSYSSDVLILPYLSLPAFLVGGMVIIYSLFGIGKNTFVLAVSLASYCGIIADHMLGNLIFINVIDIFISLSTIEEYFLAPLGLPDVPALFMYMIPVSTIERILFTIVATILGVGLILALRRANLLTRKL
ncbi:MAG: ECF transporter S component [Candidatus Bathyarchaeota archaeon]|nr:ECF transporter S component [Candidatus Bathyarchaeota archaeon]MDH5787062.1 ECF transporter S component [Candidatus Bathyarchaeota archaeon]